MTPKRSAGAAFSLLFLIAGCGGNRENRPVAGADTLLSYYLNQGQGTDPRTGRVGGTVRNRASVAGTTTGDGRQNDPNAPQGRQEIGPCICEDVDSQHGFERCVIAKRDGIYSWLGNYGQNGMGPQTSGGASGSGITIGQGGVKIGGSLGGLSGLGLGAGSGASNYGAGSGYGGNTGGYGPGTVSSEFCIRSALFASIVRPTDKSAAEYYNWNGDPNPAASSDTDKDGVKDAYELEGHERRINGIKLAAVALPSFKELWTHDGADDAIKDFFGIKDSQNLRHLLNANQAKYLLTKEKRLKTTVPAVGSIRLPSNAGKNAIAILNSGVGLGRRWVTFGGDGSGDPRLKANLGEVSSLGDIPGILRDEETLKKSDGVVVGFDCHFSYPADKMAPRFMILQDPRAGGQRSSAIVVYVKTGDAWSVLLDSFSNPQAVDNHYVGDITSACPSGTPCDVAGVLYIAKRSNSDRKMLSEHLLVDLNTNDERGPEPLPTELCSPVALKDEAPSREGDMVRVMADPTMDRDLLSALKLKSSEEEKENIKSQEADGEVDLTYNETFFTVPEPKGAEADPAAAAPANPAAGAPAPSGGAATAPAAPATTAAAAK